MRAVPDGVSLTGAGLVAAVVLGIYLVLGQPVVGAWNTRRFAAESASRHLSARSARLARYHRTLTLEWTLVLLALIAVLIGGVGLGDLGVRLPAVDSAALPYTAAGSACLLLSAGGLLSLRRRVLSAQVPVRGPQRVVELMPRGAPERRTFTALALTAGICEEFLYRGFLVLVVAALVPGVAPWRVLVICAVTFGLAHAYQGPAGILATLVVGGCLAVLYLGTGSLLLPVLFHILIDLRILLLPAADLVPEHVG